jgi:hypothetical protein
VGDQLCIQRGKFNNFLWFCKLFNLCTLSIFTEWIEEIAVSQWQRLSALLLPDRVQAGRGTGGYFQG